MWWDRPGSVPAPSAAVTAARVDVVWGGAGSGKTQALVEATRKLLDKGAMPDEITVFAASPNAARRLSERLEAAGATGVAVYTARQAALSVLGDDAARCLTGRDARVLTPYEEDFLLEDLKTCGVRPKRLRKIVEFVGRSLADLADGEPDWLQGDESLVVRLLGDQLAWRRAVMAVEASNVALRALQADGDLAARHAVPHVLVDDWTSLQRASQALLGALARTSLFVAGDPAMGATVYEAYPCPAGLEELVASRPDAHTRNLGVCRTNADPAPLAECLRASLLAEEGPAPEVVRTYAAPSSEGVATVAYSTPAEEFAGVALQAQEASATGSAYIAVPNRTWETGVRQALAQRGIACAGMTARSLPHADLRDLTRCALPRMLALLDLVADPADPVAWRSWCGFGDHLGRSQEFARLRAACTGRGLDLAAGLADPAACKDAPAVGQAYRDTLAELGGLAKLRGRDLVNAVSSRCTVPETPPAVRDRACSAFDALVGPVEPGDDAAALCQRARRRMEAPVFEGTPNGNGVCIGSLTDCRGTDPDLVIVCGAVNGFMPGHAYFDPTSTTPAQQARMYAKEVARLYAAVGSARQRVAVTWFGAAALEDAARLDLKVDRIRLQDNRRICRVSPSALLEDCGLVGGKEA